MTSSGGQWEPDTIVGQQTPRSITLAVKQGPNVGQTFTVSKDQITIGRSSSNDIAIGDQEISRHHATISWENGQFVIRDMGSSNGTTVNGTRLTAPCPLRTGDLIGLGNIMLNFQQMGVAPSHQRMGIAP